jgi:threonine dehydrogenase-like Zn-dependent dehydrogenase
VKALVYRRSVFLYLLASILSRIWPHRFFSRLSPLSLRDIPLPAPQDGWVTLRNRLCGICGSDLSLLKGAESLLMEPYASFPAVLGHEVVSEVMDAPRDSQWRPGDRVVVEPLLSCAVRGLPLCCYCAQGDYNLCENFTTGGLAPGPVLGYNSSVGGGMAEFMAVHPSQLIRVPDTLPDDLAVLTDSLASALHPVLSHFPQDSHTVVVYGVGIIGQHLLRVMRTLESRARLVAVARYPFQQELAIAGGADLALLSPDRAELGRAVGARFLPTTLGGGNLEGGAHLFFDCVGSARSLQEGVLTLRSRGRYVLVGTAGVLGRVDLSSLWFRELHLTGSNCYAWSSFQGEWAHTYEMAVHLLAGGNYQAQGLVTQIFPLSQYAKAFQAAFHKVKHQSVKVALDPRSDSRGLPG